MVNALHQRLEGFLKDFNGVSTRRLPYYLSWFCWEEQARRSDATRLGMLAPQVANGVTDMRVRATWDAPQPPSRSTGEGGSGRTRWTWTTFTNLSSCQRWSNRGLRNR